MHLILNKWLNPRLWSEEKRLNLIRASVQCLILYAFSIVSPVWFAVKQVINPVLDLNVLAQCNAASLQEIMDFRLWVRGNHEEALSFIGTLIVLNIALWLYLFLSFRLSRFITARLVDGYPKKEASAPL